MDNWISSYMEAQKKRAIGQSEYELEYMVSEVEEKIGGMTARIFRELVTTHIRERKTAKASYEAFTEEQRRKASEKSYDW